MKLCWFALSLLLPAAQAAAHPCEGPDKIQGKVTGGSALLFHLEGQDSAFGLSDLVIVDTKIEDAMKPGTELSIHRALEKPDRYGRRTGQVFTRAQDSQPKRWLQGHLLKTGQALISGITASGACLDAMRDAERVAKRQRLGVWASENTEIGSLQLDALNKAIGNFVIVWGKVQSVGDRKKRLYLNFGKKWSQDFTVQIVKSGKSTYQGDLEPLQHSSGKLVRVRGILEEGGGPLIRVTHAAQIEIDER